MTKSTVITSTTDVLVIRTNGNNHIKYTKKIISKMVREFGVSKTQDTIQALFDADRIDQLTAGFLMDDLKLFSGKKQASRMILL